MSKWTKPELENMLEDVVNALDLSDLAIEQHGPHGTAPAELVRLVLKQKDRQIEMLKAGFVQVPAPSEAARPLGSQPATTASAEELAAWEIITILDRFYGDDDYSNAEACSDLLAILRPQKAAARPEVEKLDWLKSQWMRDWIKAIRDVSVDAESLGDRKSMFRLQQIANGIESLTEPFLQKPFPASTTAPTCEWILTDADDGVWSTGCKEEFAIIEGSPEENGFKFCCMCSKPLVQAPAPNGEQA